MAPTRTAAALLGGSTYHYMFGINEYSGASNLSQIRSRLAGVDYVFLDEVSMLSARDMYRISAQLAKVFGVPDIPFGGMNMVFSGDFAQLPPAMGGENVSLYGRFIGSLSTDIKSQEESIGKALWHQISTIVILRENMRQRTQTPNDAKLRTALENMRYKSCTPDDILFLKSRISSSVPNRPSVCDDNFRNISIIMARNLHKDEINRVGAMRFANETGQSLTEFYSDDTTKVSQKSAATAAKATGTKHRLITPEIQDALWSQPPSTTDKQITGKLSLCIGMPVMIRTNFATELCLTRGQEGFVRGWQSSVGGSNQQILDTLFVELKNPPREINIDGLEPNVVPITRTVNAVTAILPDNSTIAIQRGQVEILINFAMTDFASQGKTRPYNVVDLNNLTTHQAYYTALSRSASADGTIILQGFDSSKITGRASGALRQEFRELEILDDMTRLHYEGKLKLPLTGNTRNVLISEFRSSKGSDYIPHRVHKAIRWSKRDPFQESEIHDINWRIIDNKSSKKATKVQTESEPTNLSPSDTCNNIKMNITTVSLMDHSVSRRRKSHDTDSGDNLQDHKLKRTKFNASCVSQFPEQLVPLGIIWSQNSCAYDSLIAIIYSVWSRNPDQWIDKCGVFSNDVLSKLFQDFIPVIHGQQTIEVARENLRQRMQSIDRTRFAFGRYTSITSLVDVVLSATYPVLVTQWTCSNGHHIHHSYANSGLISLGVTIYASMEEHNSKRIIVDRSCRLCASPVTIYNFYENFAPILTYEFGGNIPTINLRINLRSQDASCIYQLCGLIYFGGGHFTSRIIRADGQIWFHDGIISGRATVYHGSIHTSQVDLKTCMQKDAIMAVYTTIEN